MVVQRRLEHAATAQSVVSASPLLPVPPAGNGCVLALWCCSTSMQRQYCHHWPGCWAGVWGLGAVVVQERHLSRVFLPSDWRQTPRWAAVDAARYDATAQFYICFRKRITYNCTCTGYGARCSGPNANTCVTCESAWTGHGHVWAAGRDPRIYVFLVTGT